LFIEVLLVEPAVVGSFALPKGRAHAELLEMDGCIPGGVPFGRPGKQKPATPAEKG